MSIGLIVSKPGKQATSVFDADLLFDSEKGTHPVFSELERKVDANGYSFAHNLGFHPKVWANLINATSSRDSRLPIEDDSVPPYDYKIDDRRITVNRGAATDKNIRFIVFAKSINNN